VPGLLSQQALGLAQSGSGLIGSIGEIYLLRKLLEQGSTQAGPTPTARLPWSDPFTPIYYPDLYTPSPLTPGFR